MLEIMGIQGKVYTVLSIDPTFKNESMDVQGEICIQITNQIMKDLPTSDDTDEINSICKQWM